MEIELKLISEYLTLTIPNCSTMKPNCICLFTNAWLNKNDIYLHTCDCWSKDRVQGSTGHRHISLGLCPSRDNTSDSTLKQTILTRLSYCSIFIYALIYIFL